MVNVNDITVYKPLISDRNIWWYQTVCNYSQSAIENVVMIIMKH